MLLLIWFLSLSFSSGQVTPALEAQHKHYLLTRPHTTFPDGKNPVSFPGSHSLMTHDFLYLHENEPHTVCDLASCSGRRPLGDPPLVLFTVCCTQHMLTNLTDVCMWYTHTCECMWSLSTIVCLPEESHPLPLRRAVPVVGFELHQ